MANNSMNFAVDLLPSTTNTYNLGNSSKKWNIYANSINGLPQILYGTCATEASTAAKVVSNINGFSLTSGVTIHVTFTYANSATSPTLNVNSTGAKSIILNNDNISPWDAGDTVTLTFYDDTWLINDYGKVEVVILE